MILSTKIMLKVRMQETLLPDIRRGTGQRMILGRVQRLALRKPFIRLETLISMLIMMSLQGDL